MTSPEPIGPTNAAAPTPLTDNGTPADAHPDRFRALLGEHPEWCRSHLSVELCERWGWRNAQGRIKDMAARTLLLKLERAGHIRLPARRSASPNGRRNRHMPDVKHATEPIRGALCDLQPLTLTVVAPGSEDLRRFNGLLAHEHYLGHRNTVGENLRYLVRDRHGRRRQSKARNLLDRFRDHPDIVRRHAIRLLRQKLHVAD